MLENFEHFLDSLPQKKRKNVTFISNSPSELRKLSLKKLSAYTGIEIESLNYLISSCGFDTYEEFLPVFLGDKALTSGDSVSADSSVDSNLLVTIIIPAYNACETVKTTVLTALAQSHGFIEVVVVDDGSVDNTREIVSHLCQNDGRIRLIAQPNYGVAAARNTGIRNSLGDYLAFLDADDIWHPDKVSLQLRRLRETGCGLVYSPYRVIDEESRVIWTPPFFDFTGDASLVMLQIHLSGNGSSVMCTREVAREAGGFDERLNRAGMQGCEDFLFAAKAAACTNTTCAPWFLIGLRKLSNSMSTDSLQMMRSREYALGIIVQESILPIPKKMLRWSRGTASAPQFLKAVSDFNPLLACKTLFTGLINDPLAFGSMLNSMVLSKLILKKKKMDSLLPFHTYDIDDGPYTVPSKLIARRLTKLNNYNSGN